MVFQLTANEAKSMRQISEVITSYKELIDKVEKKFPTCKILLSLAPVKYNGSRFSIRAAAINATLSAEYLGTNVICIDNGGIPPYNFHVDGVHLTQYGTSNLASNMKRALEYQLVSKRHNRYY